MQIYFQCAILVLLCFQSFFFVCFKKKPTEMRSCSNLMSNSFPIIGEIDLLPLEHKHCYDKNIAYSAEISYYTQKVGPSRLCDEEASGRMNDRRDVSQCIIYIMPIYSCLSCQTTYWYLHLWSLHWCNRNHPHPG